MDECQKDISKQSVQVFGRRMRQNILVYFSLAKAKEDQVFTNRPIHTNNRNIIHLHEMSLHLVERTVKPKRCHWNIADQEHNFFNFHAADERDITKS